MKNFEQLRQHWVSAGLQVGYPVTALALHEFEAKHDLLLPVSFKTYLSTADGCECDESLITFLSLGQIDTRQNTPVSADEVHIIIAEYLIYSHFYEMRSNRAGTRSPVFAADGEHEKRLAASFDEFIELYVADPSAVAYCW